MQIDMKAIGVVRTNAKELPRHWSVSDVEGTLVIGEAYVEGLRDIRPGEGIVVLFHFDRSRAFTAAHLRQVSGDTGKVTGVFSTCSPIRPNPIGMSVVEVRKIDGASIHVRRLDMLDGTPVLDVKPYVAVGDD